MKGYRPLLLLVASLALNACSASAPQVEQAVKDPNPTPVSTHVVQLENLLRGDLVPNGNEAQFTPCGSEQAYRVSLNESDRQLLDTLALDAKHYVEFNAQFSPSTQSSHLAHLAITQWHVIEKLGEGCKGKATQVQAMGDTWQLSIENSQMYYQSANETRRDSIQQHSLSQYERSYRSHNMQLQLRVQACIDEKSGNYYSHVATLNLGNAQRTGCARLPFDSHGERMAGFYFAELNTDTPQHIQLTLNADFSAQLEQHDLNSKRSQQLSGYWQHSRKANTPVKVHFSQQQMQFEWNGQTLQLQQALRHGFADGLSLHKMDGPSSPIVAAPNYPPRSLNAQTLDANSHFDSEVHAALQNYFQLHRTQPNGERYQWWRFDLNGDGDEEILIYMNWCKAQQNCALLIFDGRKKAQHFLSKIDPAPVPFHLGHTSFAHWQDILFELNDGKARRLRFDGLGYPLTPSEQMHSAAQSAGVVFTAKPFTPGVGVHLR